MSLFRKLKDWRSKGKAKAAQSAAASEIMARFNQRINQRRQEWEEDERELRRVMAAAAGGSWQPLTSPKANSSATSGRPLSEMAGINARYDSALTTEDNYKHWGMADGMAADAQAQPGVRYVLRNRARYEVANNCYARGVGETIANDFVGTGPRLHITDERLSIEERTDIERKFEAWSNAVNLAGKLRTMRKAKRQDGEAFACKITNPNLGHPIKLDIRPIEADQVRFVDINLLTVPSVDGIRFDDYGNPVSYHVLRVHPGYWSYATGYVGFPWEYDVWDAKFVIHWFRQDRPGQHRGVPEITPALPLYATLRRWTQACLDAAETAADFAVLLKTQSGANLYDADGNEIQPEAAAAFTAMELQRRMMVALPAGYEATQMQAQHPNQEYSPFKREVCGEIGRCENVPINVVLGDSSQNSFASGQLDHKIYFRTREIERDEAEHIILNPLMQSWIDFGVLLREGNGDYGKPYLPPILRNIADTLEHQWHWDSNDMGDMLKTASAHAVELKSGLTTIPALYARKNQDWRKAFAEIAASMGVPMNEVQELVRNSIFATRGEEPIDTTDGGDSATPKPGQAATQAVTQSV